MILPHNSLQNDCFAEVVDSDMNHSDTEPDSDSDEESYVDCEEATVVSLLLSVRISFIAILRLIF